MCYGHEIKQDMSGNHRGLFLSLSKKKRRAGGSLKNLLNTNQKDLSVHSERRQQRRGGENKYDGSEKSLKILYKGRNIPRLDKSPPINRLPMPIS